MNNLTRKLILFLAWVMPAIWPLAPNYKLAPEPNQYLVVTLSDNDDYFCICKKSNLEEFWTILLIYALCTVKIIFGPTMGYAAGLSPLLTVIITVAGMMTTVLIVSFIGEWVRTTVLKRFIKPKKVFTKRNRRFVKVWRKYGELGISFLTPILLSPPGGTIIAVALGGSKRKIIAYMLLWSIVWTTIITYTFYYSGDALRQLISS